MTEAQTKKQQAIDILRRRYDEQRAQVAAIEPRLAAYYDDLCEHVGIEQGDANDLHNRYELLGAIKFLRLLRTYEFNSAKVSEVIFDGEGEWRQEGKKWQHIRGGLRQPGRTGEVVYRWEPFQVFMLCAIYGPMGWIDTCVDNGTRDILPTERENPDTGTIEDLRRLCTRFILFGPRKINKSGFCAITNVEDFMRGDNDAQIFCVANSQDQSKILFEKTSDLLRQLDPPKRSEGKYINFTKTVVRFKPGKFRSAQMQALAAGGKLPDGWFASRGAFDEYGSAAYVNGASDMGKTASVVESSMGPRREPQTLITTTASTITSGPFIEMLEATHIELDREVLYDTGEATPTQAEDRRMCLLLEPDQWERDEEYLLTSRTIRQKINPMLGLIVQHSFYEDEVSKARQDEQKKRETIAKLFNVYQQANVSRWKVSSDDIRACQIEKRVTDCKFAEGWQTFVGLDFSNGGDFDAITYLSVDMRPTGPMLGRWFADCEAWITEEELTTSPNRPLYEKWIEQGWLRLCPGKVFNPDLAIHDLMAKSEAGVNLAYFGYDPAQSSQPINTLKAWLQTLGIDAQTIKQMVVPVSQSAMTFNPLIGNLEQMVLNPDEPWIQFSPSPLWPWEAGNVSIDESRYSNQRMVKTKPHTKIDNFAALLDALYCFNISEGKLQ